MTDYRKPGENNGEADPRFENIAAYVLHALDNDDERAAVETLIETNLAARAEFDELTEAADLLAIAVPPVAPPARLKARILELAAQEPVPGIRPTATPAAPIDMTSRGTPKSTWWSRTFQSGYVVSATAAVLVLVAAGVLAVQNDRLGSEIDSLRSELEIESVAIASLRTELSTMLSDSESTVAAMKGDMDQMEDEFGATAQIVADQEQKVSKLAVVNTALRQALRDQSWLSYVAMKEGFQAESWLGDNRNTSVTPGASGLFAARIVGNEAVFQVQGLEQPLPGFAYTLWLLGNGEPMPVSQFEVSEIGSATIAFLLPAPFFLYTSLVVTQEPVDGVGAQPSDVQFLSAKAN